VRCVEEPSKAAADGPTTSHAIESKEGGGVARFPEHSWCAIPVGPTLLAATTLMLLLPNPKRLILGYLLGDYATSITVGLLIVFSLNRTSTAKTAKHTVRPLEASDRWPVRPHHGVGAWE
jgi:hypothetical protein